MKMSEHFVALEKELHDEEEILQEAENKINEFLAKAEEAEAEMKKWQAKAEEVEADNMRLKMNVANLKEMLAIFERCDFAPTEEELIKQKQEQKKKEALAKVKQYEPRKSWTRRKGEIGQFKPDGSIMNSWTSQRSAAMSLNWSQTGVGKFMKTSRENQIRKKGFYLEYMG